MVEVDDVIEGRVDSLAFGGEGILRHEGLVVFVPFTAPADFVRVKIGRRLKSYAYGELEQVLEPSADRVVPRCPYFGTCGGCTLQHISYEEQLRQKSHFVTDALQRIGKVPLLEAVPIMPSSEPWAYRRLIRLALQKAEHGFVAGYVSIDNRDFVRVQECPIFLEHSNPLLAEIQGLLSHLPSHAIQSARLSIVKLDDGRFSLAFHLVGQATRALMSLLSEFLGLHEKVAGILVEDSVKVQTLGDTNCQFEFDGLRIKFSPLAFVQSHPEQSLNLYRSVTRIALRIKATKVLDLYCGIGVTSLLLAKEGMKVIGVEGNELAVALAKENAATNGVTGAEFQTGDVARAIRQLLRTAPDLVVINPPRTGVDQTTREILAQNGPSNLIYVSCMPATLARDVAAFCAAGYQLVSCEAYDMFPQTTHVETIAFLQRAAGQPETVK